MATVLAPPKPHSPSPERLRSACDENRRRRRLTASQHILDALHAQKGESSQTAGNDRREKQNHLGQPESSFGFGGGLVLDHRAYGRRTSPLYHCVGQCALARLEPSPQSP